MRRDGGRRPAEGPGAAGLGRAEGRRGAAAGRDRGGGRRAGAPAHRPGRQLQDRAGRRAAAEDPIGENPARHDAPHRRRRGLPHAGDDRRPGNPAGNRRSLGAGGLSAEDSRGLQRRASSAGSPAKIPAGPASRERFLTSRPARFPRCRPAPPRPGAACRAGRGRRRRRVPPGCTGRARPGGAA